MAPPADVGRRGALAAGAVGYTVNGAGNETARGSDTFSYDQANRLTSATVGGVTTTYAYDGDGKRISSTVGGTTTRYVYDVGLGLPVLLDDGTQKYVSVAGGLACSVNKTSSAPSIYHTDGLGSVQAITDSTGSVVQTYQTDEFGVPTQAQAASPQPFGYTGEQVDPTGLVYLRSRTYDPTAGRFLQRNPLPGFISSITAINRCSYTQDNPVSLVDHTGLSPADINPYQDNCLITWRLNLRWATVHKDAPGSRSSRTRRPGSSMTELLGVRSINEWFSDRRRRVIVGDRTGDHGSAGGCA